MHSHQPVTRLELIDAITKLHAIGDTSSSTLSKVVFKEKCQIGLPAADSQFSTPDCQIVQRYWLYQVFQLNKNN